MRMIYLESVWEEDVSEDDLPGVCVGEGMLVRMIYLESVWEGGC